MTAIVTLILILSYVIFRQFLFDRRKIHQKGIIDRISLCVIHPDTILPEVEVFFKYYFGGGVYKGKGYCLLTDFLSDTDYRIEFNAFLEPILFIGDKVFVSMEHIESYLLSSIDTVILEIDPVEPYRVKLLGLNEESQGAKKI